MKAQILREIDTTLYYPQQTQLVYTTAVLREFIEPLSNHKLSISSHKPIIHYHIALVHCTTIQLYILVTALTSQHIWTFPEEHLFIKQGSTQCTMYLIFNPFNPHSFSNSQAPWRELLHFFSWSAPFWRYLLQLTSSSSILWGMVASQ